MKKTIITTASITAALTAIILTFVLFNPFGCASTPKPNDPRPQIDSVKKTNQSVAEVLPERAKKIDTSADQIVTTVGPKTAVQIGPPVAAIKAETAGLRQDAGQLQGTIQQLDQARAAASELQAANGKLDATVKKLEAERDNALRKLMGSLIVLSVIGVGISAALFATGSKIGITTGIGSLVTLVVAVIVSQYSFWIALSAGGVLLAGIVYVIVQHLRERKATVELVATNEIAKQSMAEPQRDQVFGVGAIHGQADIVQSPSTQSLVQSVRGKMSKAKVRLAA